MGPVWQNPIQRTVRTAHLSVLMTVHSFSTQYNTEQFWRSPLLPPNNYHSSKLSIAEEGAGSVWKGLHLYVGGQLSQLENRLSLFLATAVIFDYLGNVTKNKVCSIGLTGTESGVWAAVCPAGSHLWLQIGVCGRAIVTTFKIWNACFRFSGHRLATWPNFPLTAVWHTYAVLVSVSWS